MMLNVALSYDVGICQYIQKAWREQNVMNLLADDHIGCTLVTLSVALWACWHASSFEEGHLSVENAGGDADTHSAVACAILGAKYGYQSFPHEYTEGLLYGGHQVRAGKDFRSYVPGGSLNSLFVCHGVILSSCCAIPVSVAALAS